MARWAINGPIPCEITYTDEYHEGPSVSVFVDGDAYIEIHGTEETTRLFFSLEELGALIGALEGAEEFITEDDDGDTDCDGVGGKYTGVDHLAAASSSDAD